MFSTFLRTNPGSIFRQKYLDALLENLSCFNGTVVTGDSANSHDRGNRHLRLFPLEVVARPRQEDQMLLDLWQSHGHPHYLIYRATYVWALGPILLFP
jgi:hypothetical protein